MVCAVSLKYSGERMRPRSSQPCGAFPARLARLMHPLKCGEAGGRGAARSGGCGHQGVPAAEAGWPLPRVPLMGAQPRAQTLAVRVLHNQEEQADGVHE